MAATPSKRKRKAELLSRSGLVGDWSGYIHILADRKGGEGARMTLMSLEIRGVFSQPIRGVAAFRLRVTPESNPSTGNVEIPCVGVWISTKPLLDGGVSLSDREFDLVRTMASSGKLVSVHVNCQEPHYGKSLIASVSFSSDPPEAE